jgi:hypothetical protein
MYDQIGGPVDAPSDGYDQIFDLWASMGKPLIVDEFALFNSGNTATNLLMGDRTAKLILMLRKDNAVCIAPYFFWEDTDSGTPWPYNPFFYFGGGYSNGVLTEAASAVFNLESLIGNSLCSTSSVQWPYYYYTFGTNTFVWLAEWSATTGMVLSGWSSSPFYVRDGTPAPTNTLGSSPIILSGNGSIILTDPVPSGEFTYAFTNAPLWDASGSYTNNTETNDVVIADIQIGANGQITGTQTETYVDGADHADASGPITGKVFVRAGVVGASLNDSGGIMGVSGSVGFTETYRGKITDTIDPSSLTIFDSGSTTVCDVGTKCVTKTSTHSFALPAGMNGDWTLETDISAAGNSLTGAGTLTLSNGRILLYQINGSYNTKSQIAKLKFIGEGDATGTSLSVTTRGTGMALVSLKGKVLGQKLAFALNLRRHQVRPANSNHL